MRFPHEEYKVDEGCLVHGMGPLDWWPARVQISLWLKYRPQDGRIQIHQLHVTPFPPEFIVTPPKCVDQLLTQQVDMAEETLSAQEPGSLTCNGHRGGFDKV